MPVTVNVDEPAAVGVPESVPSPASARPAGSEPLETASEVARLHGLLDEVAQARDEGIVAPDVLGRSGGAAYCNRSQGNIVHITNLDQ